VGDLSPPVFSTYAADVNRAGGQRAASSPQHAAAPPRVALSPVWLTLPAHAFCGILPLESSNKIHLYTNYDEDG
jgi:hypothetical protein